jgi:hypothetical protein
MKTFLNKSHLSSINLFLVFFTLLVISGLIILRRWLPVNTLVAYFDDGLFLSRAEFILSGQLGEINWGFNALVKGTFYPWFIVFGNKINLNPIFLTYLTLVLLVLLLGFIVYKINKNIIISAGLIIIALADPLYFSDGSSRLLRELTQQNLVLLFLILLNSTFYLISRYKISPIILVSFSILSGLALAVSINVREENIWIYSAYSINVIILFLSRKFKITQIVSINLIITQPHPA